ncbi:receptor-like protein kinase [Melia azedarach]|uniref:Receptor-like protein kinase n=1 Tax=Melia azedarach TaxID=155640 RepID=A0ACC1Y681_MELAZ|nr:receptor-like protein kinase [Melia azedarach]
MDTKVVWTARGLVYWKSRAFSYPSLLKNMQKNILNSWVDDGMSDCCNWESVQCNATTRRVMQLSFIWTRKFDYDNDNAFNGFPILDFSLFLPFQELQSLDLLGHGFEGWKESKANYDDSFGSLKQLKMLDLSDNYFNDSVLSYLSTLTSLTTLNLGFNSIESVKPKQGLANLRNLQELDLSGNNIKGLGLSNLTNLKVLNLGGNDMKDPFESEELVNLRNLEELDLGDNGINSTGLSKGFGNLRNLRRLDLTGNQITTLGSLTSQGNRNN